MNRRSVLCYTLLLCPAFAAVAAETTMRAEPIWIDVRTPAEYESGHLPGARNINFDRIGEQIAGVTGDKTQPIALYCKSGRRSGFAKQILERLGYTNVINAGGVSEVLRKTGAAPARGPDCLTREC